VVAEDNNLRMALVLQPWQILVAAMVGWISGQQDAVIEYLREENRMLKFVLSIKDERLNRTIFFGERSLRKATNEFASHYHSERNHQGITNRLIEPKRRDGSAGCCASITVSLRDRLSQQSR
jgi:hypothetical protein